MSEKITVDEIKKFAVLSRIKITDEEAEKYSKQFNDIIPFIAQITEWEKKDNNIIRDFKRINIFRKDEIKENNNYEEILKEMPNVNNEKYLKVKKILNN